MNLELPLIELDQKLDGLEVFILKSEMEESEIKKSRANCPVGCRGGSYLGSMRDVMLPSIVQIKQLNYNSIVISLYGAFEQFIEKIVESYIDIINGFIPKHSNLPKSIRENSIKFSVDLLSKLSLHRYKDVKIEDLVRNLDSCLKNENPYRINQMAFSMHSSNVRWEQLKTIVGGLGIDRFQQRIASSLPYINYVQETEGVRPSKPHPEDKVRAIMDDLAGRRNDVGHGISAEILSYELMRSYIKYIRVICASIFSVLLDELGPLFPKTKLVSLGSPILIVRKTIVCLSFKQVKLCPGSILVAQGTRNNMKVGVVTRIEVNKIPVESLDIANVPQKAGLETTREFHPDDSFFLYVP